MHQFVTGVLRWQTRVTAFVLSVNDQVPTVQHAGDRRLPHRRRGGAPQGAQPSLRRLHDHHPVLAVAGGISFAVRLIGHADTISSSLSNGASVAYQLNFPSFGGGGLLLRQLAAIPHFIVLAFVGIAAFVLWFIVQWVILFVANFPRGMWDIEAGYVRWYTRVNAYALGLVDRYPPFSMSPSLSAGEAGASAAAPPPPPPRWSPRGRRRRLRNRPLLRRRPRSPRNHSPRRALRRPRAARAAATAGVAATAVRGSLARGLGMPHTTLSRQVRDPRGALAQLGERLDRTQEVSGSNPLCSTTPQSDASSGSTMSTPVSWIIGVAGS